jgi:hypothetical protein
MSRGLRRSCLLPVVQNPEKNYLFSKNKKQRTIVLLFRHDPTQNVGVQLLFVVHVLIFYFICFNYICVTNFSYFKHQNTATFVTDINDNWNASKGNEFVSIDGSLCDKKFKMVSGFIFVCTICGMDKNGKLAILKIKAIFLKKGKFLTLKFVEHVKLVSNFRIIKKFFFEFF